MRCFFGNCAQSIYPSRHFRTKYIYTCKRIFGLYIRSSERKTKILLMLLPLLNCIVRFFGTHSSSAARDLPACFTTKNGGVVGSDPAVDPPRIPSNAALPAYKLVPLASGYFCDFQNVPRVRLPLFYRSRVKKLIIICGIFEKTLKHRGERIINLWRNVLSLICHACEYL